MTKIDDFVQDNYINHLFKKIKELESTVDSLVVASGSQIQKIRVFRVTVPFAANEVINITTGSGASTGASTPSGHSIALPDNSPDFIGNVAIVVQRNGVEQIKDLGEDVVRDSTNSLHFTASMRVGEIFIIKVPTSYE